MGERNPAFFASSTLNFWKDFFSGGGALEGGAFFKVVNIEEQNLHIFRAT